MEEPNLLFISPPRSQDMRILNISDTHGKPSVIEASSEVARKNQPDIITLSGDITHRGAVYQIKEMVTRLHVLSNIPVYFVSGNMDPASIQDSVFEEGTFYVKDRALEVGRFKIIGLSGSPPTLFNTVYERSEEELREALERNKQDAENAILLSHAPPYGTELDKTRAGSHAGSQAVLDFINEHQPLLVLCGHVHEAQGISTIGRTTVVNPGAAIHGKASLIEIDQNDLMRAEFLTL